MKLKLLFVAMAIVGVILTLNINNALAEPTVVIGNDAYPNAMYDYRTYHESHPLSGLPNNTGSNWVIGLTVHNPDAYGLINKGTIQASDTIEGLNYNVTINSPAIYPWGGDTFHDYSVWLNNLAMLPAISSFQFTAIASDGSPIQFDDDGMLLDSLTLPIDTDDPLPPICKIKHMAIKKNGDLKMRFTAPYDIRDSHIRIRIFDAEGLGLDYVDNGNGGNAAQIKLFPPFQIVKKNGTIIPDKVKVTDIPAIFAGRTGRIEYRVNTDTGFLYRGITYFKLPELEDEE